MQHTHERHLDAINHEPARPYSREPEVLGLYACEAKDADEWMVASATYHVETGVLHIHGKCWMGVVDEELSDAEVVDWLHYEPTAEDEVTESVVDDLILRYHESLI